MEFPYSPPRHLEHLVKVTFRSQLGWGIDDDGSVGVQHIISSNPFAGKGQQWGVALIDENGDIGIMSKGPGNAKAEEDLPPELIQKIVQFYEKEGLNVRNITETDPASKEATEIGPPAVPGPRPVCPNCGNTENIVKIDTHQGNLYYCPVCQTRALGREWKFAEIEQGLALCPECHSEEVYIVPDGPMGHSDWFDCENCGYHGNRDELVDGKVDPDPDRYQIDEDDKQPEGTDYNDDWRDYVSKKEAAGGFSAQGAVASPGKNVITEGIAVNPRMGREAIEKLVGGLDDAGASGRQQEFVDQMNRGQGTSFPPNDSPYLNRGGSIYAESIEDHFFETKEAAPTPPGIPGTGVGDPRNFDPQSQPGFIVVADYLTPDDNWLFTNKCKGIVTKVGGTNSHGAVVAREMGITAIVAIEEAENIQPGDHVRLDPDTGRVDVNGGSQDFEVGEQKRAANEVARFVWSQGHMEFSPATQPLTDDLAALPYNGGNEPDRSHYAMIEFMDEQGQYDWEDGTIGVVYDSGEAQYFEPISDEADLKNAVMSTFPKVHTVVYKPVQGGIYGPGAGAETVNAKVAEIHDEAPECPNCGSHTYDVVNFPQASGDDGELQCLTCGNHYTQPLIMNPKNSEYDDRAYGEQTPSYPTDPAQQAQVIDLMHQIAQASQQGNQSEVQRLQRELEQLLGGNTQLPTTVQPTVNGKMQKGAPYPSDSYKNSPDHTPKGQKEWPSEVNAIYNACMREGNGKGDSKEEKQSSCAAIAWSQYEKTKKKKDSKLIHKEAMDWQQWYYIASMSGLISFYGPAMVKDIYTLIQQKLSIRDLQNALRERGVDDTVIQRVLQSLKTEGVPDLMTIPTPQGIYEHQFPGRASSDDDKVGPVEPKDAPGGALAPGTRIEITHKDKAGQKGTIVEYHGTDGAFDDDAYDIVLDSGDRIKGVREVDLKKIKRSSFDLITGNYPYDFKVLADEFLPEDNGNIVCPECGSHEIKPSNAYTSGIWECANCGRQDYYENFQKHSSIAINDSNGAPLQIGQLYLMHSTQYKVPDLVRIVAVDPNRIEAHIDSDVNGMFPIDISKESFSDEGYSFEPYTKKEAKSAEGQICDDALDLLYQQGGIPTPEEASQALEQTIQEWENYGTEQFDPDKARAMFPEYLRMDWPNHFAKIALVDEDMNSLYAQVLADLNGQPSTPEAAQISQELLNRYGPTAEVLRAIPDADALSNFVNYKDKYMEGYSKVATRKLTVTPKRQKELINENMGAKARNFDKLNLEGTHYTIWEPITSNGTSIEDHFIF